MIAININRTTKNIVRIILVVIVWISMSDYAYTYARAVNITNSRSLLFLGNKNLPPMVYQENERPKGVVVDIVAALGKKMGRTIDIKAMNWTSAQKIVKQGNADALMQINQSVERKKIYDFSEPLLESEFSIFTHTKGFDIAGIDDLSGLRVAVERNGFPKTILKSDPLIRIVNVNSILNGFGLLIENKVDAVVVDKWVGEYIIATNKIKEVKIAGKPIYKQMSSIAVKKGNRGLLTAINNGLKQMKEDGTYKDILKKWQSKEVVFLTEDQLKLKQYEIRFKALFVVIVVIIGTGSLLIGLLCKSKRIELELKSKKELLEAVIETMHDSLIVYDKKGNIIMINAEARKLYPDINAQSTVNTIYNGYQYFDLDNKMLQLKNMPSIEVLKGNTIRNNKIIIKHKDFTKCTEVNATPIFDDDNNLVSAVVSHHDITELINNQTEIKKQQEKIIKIEEEKNEVLEKTLVMKDEFLINISHELKTPLNVIYSTVQLFNMYCINGTLDENKSSVIKYIDSIRKNSYRLSKLINNILDLSKIESGFLELNLSNNNIVEVVEDIVMSVTDYTESKGINIIFDTDLEENIIACDPEKIERIVLNLISNAVKFSNAGDEIFVQIINKNKFVEISVKDNGIGIEENNLHMIFDRYKQVDKSLSRNVEGSGIGLSLVKSIVELHGGSIYVESEYGKGSKFTVAIPTGKVIHENMLLNNKMRNRFENVKIEFSDIN